MFSRVLGDPEEIPVPPNRRSNTDCLCCVITSVFAIALLVLAIISYNTHGMPPHNQEPTTTTTLISNPISSAATPKISPAKTSKDSHPPSSGLPSYLLD